MTTGNRRPSPALIVAVIALVAALAGSAVALPGKGSVDKNDLAKNVVKSKNIKNNSVKGVDINESTLGKVPSAAQADQAASAAQAANADAVGGVRVVPINAILPDDGATTPIVNVGGLRIDLECATNSVVDALDATTTASDAFILSSSQSGGGITNSVSDDSFASGDTIDLIPNSGDEEHFTTYFDDGTGAGGVQLRAEYTIGQDDGSVDDATGCYAIGTVEIL